MSDIGIGAMIEFCGRSGYWAWAWAVQHLQPECRRRAQAASPDLDGGPSYIVRVTRHWFPNDEELLGELDQIEKQDPRHHEGRLWAWRVHSTERGDSVERGGILLNNVPRLLGQWLRQAPSLSRFRVVSVAQRARGTRRDLAILRENHVEAAPGHVEAILADVEFAVMRRSLD